MVMLVIGVWRLSETLKVSSEVAGLVYGLPIALLVAGLWVCFRVNNYPKFADFLIAVEGEMHKVSWPTWPVLVRSSMVVIALIFLMAFALFLFDVVWKIMFQAIGIVS